MYLDFECVAVQRGMLTTGEGKITSHDLFFFFPQDVVIDGYRVPGGYYVGFLTRAANCDPKIFPEAETFLPERWDTW